MIENWYAAICDVCGETALAARNDRGGYVAPDGWVWGTKTNRDICFCPQCAGKLGLIRGKKDGDE